MTLANILHKTRIGLMIAAVSTGLYASYATPNLAHAVGVPSAYSQKGNVSDKNTEYSSISPTIELTKTETPVVLDTNFSLNLQDPAKDFEEYMVKYVTLSQDGVIDSKDVEQLEEVMRRTTERLATKIFDSSGNIDRALIQHHLGQNYVQFYSEMTQDLGLLQGHLRIREVWLNSKAYKGDFINYGSGFWLSAGSSINGNLGFYKVQHELQPIGLQVYFSSPRDFEREQIYPNLSGKKIISLGLSEEFPTKTKIPKLFGVGVGLFLPLIVNYIGVRRRRKKDPSLSAEAAFLSGTKSFFGNGVLGFILLDSFHPLVYPARLIAPVVYEGVQQIKSGIKKTKKNSSKKN